MIEWMEHNLSLPFHAVLARIQDGIMQGTSYFGIQTLKSPMDAWIYQEILFESQPDVIIEIGNFHGGSALYLAHLCDSLAKGRVIGIDISHKNLSRLAVDHPRITFIEGDACESFDRVRSMVQPGEKVLLIEDSAHTYDNTISVLRKYSTLLTEGDYFIVEDGICHHGLEIGPQPGPYEAIEAFIAENESFEIDRSRERFFVTWNPKGYLRKICPSEKRHPATYA
jgi:cephalosporin hydroxylase